MTKHDAEEPSVLDGKILNKSSPPWRYSQHEGPIGSPQVSRTSASVSRKWIGHDELPLRVLALLACLPFCILATGVEAELSSDTILMRVAEGNSKSHGAAYSGLREYRLRNHRFGKEAFALVQVTYRPDTGKDLAVLQKSGSPRLLEILEKLFASELQFSAPDTLTDYEISPANYVARYMGETDAGERSCYVIELIPKRKSKYLLKGTVWVDPRSYGIVRFEGVTAASVSIWVGTPHITQDFIQIDRLWLPSHTLSFSSGFLLGASELEVQYSNYVVEDRDRLIPGKIVDGVQQPILRR